MNGIGPFYAGGEGCTYGYRSTSGHSIFTIVDEGRYEPDECSVDVY